MSKITSLDISSIHGRFEFESGTVITTDPSNAESRRLHFALAEAADSGDEVGFIAQSKWIETKENVRKAIGDAFATGVEAAGGIVGEIVVREIPREGGVDFEVEGTAQRAPHATDNDVIVKVVDTPVGYRYTTAKGMTIEVPFQDEALTNALGMYALAKTEIRIVDVQALQANFENLKSLAGRAAQEAFSIGHDEGYAKAVAEAVEKAEENEKLRSTLKVEQLNYDVLLAERDKLADIVDNLRLPQTAAPKPTVEIETYEPGRGKGRIQSVERTNESVTYILGNGGSITLPIKAVPTIRRLDQAAEKGTRIGIVEDADVVERLVREKYEEKRKEGYDDGYEEGYQDANADNDAADDFVEEYTAGHADGVNEVIDEMLASIGKMEADPDRPTGDGEYVLGNLDGASVRAVENFIRSFGYLSSRGATIPVVAFHPPLPQTDVYVELAKFIRETLMGPDVIYLTDQTQEKGRETCRAQFDNGERFVGKRPELGMGYGRHDIGFPKG
jgi:flagellar biosynthesis/type III secretory pathway protein FliH